ncbi:MAG: VanW family protein [Oscillospiraceae bacterium]|nr:VanW family protein [Oscillospiraceae bacterium]
MSEGKFSQPRPHRDEERQIEESFRQLTQNQPRRRPKQNSTEEEIQKTIQEISAQEVSLPEENDFPLARSGKLEETVQISPEQLPPRQPAPRMPRRKTEYDLIPENLDTFFAEQPQEEVLPEEEPDFIDKLMHLGDFFRTHQTPVILGLCGAALLLIVLFVSIFFTGSKGQDAPVLAGNIYLADVNINGMTKEEAIKAVEQVTDSTYRYNDMVVDLGTSQLILSPKDTGAQLDVRAAVDAAFALAPSQQPQYIALLPYLQLNTDYILGTLTAYAEDTGSTLTQTSYGLEGDEPVLSADKFNQQAPTQTLIIVMGTPGIGFDARDVYEKVLDAYSLHQFRVEVTNVETATEPDPIDLEAIYKEFYIAPVNASINLQTFETIAGSYGYEFDLAEATALVAKAQHGEVLRIPMKYIPPEILDNTSLFGDTLGQHQTRGTSNDSRNKNLQLACSALNGTVLNPGETLSFSTILNKASGYRMAPEDTGMDDVEQGGVTQVASTLYYAALLSDLNISSRSNHSYLPSFIDYGLDAGKDLKLLNSTGYPIRIDAEYTGGYVKISILGTEERSHYVMLDSSISNSSAPGTVYEDFPYDNAEGYEDGDVLEEGSAGYLVKSYKVKYDRKTGKELSRDFLTNSQYPAVDRVVARVEAPPETEPPTEAPTLPPVTEPPATEPPATLPPATEEPTQPPTEASVIEIPPETVSEASAE